MKRLMVLWACLQALASLCFILLLKQKQTDGSTSTSGTFKPSNESNDRKSTKNTELANENSRLTECKKGSTNQDEEFNLRKNASLHGHAYGWEIMKIPDFWLLIATFIIGSALTKLFIFNFGTYLRSFKQEQHIHIIISTAPWCSLAVQIFVGFVSDIYVEKIPRLIFLVLITIFNTPLYCAFIFVADHIIFMYFVTYVSFASNGIYFLIGPLLIAEYFGDKYFGINYGATHFIGGSKGGREGRAPPGVQILSIFMQFFGKFGNFVCWRPPPGSWRPLLGEILDPPLHLADGCFTLLLQFILGLLYDFNVIDKSLHNCYGLHCYYVSSGILFALSIATLSTCVTLYIKRHR